MKPLEFVNQLRKLVVDENTAIYKDLFNNTDPNTATDDYWVKALLFFNKLDTNDKEVFFKILRQIEVDTTSNILAVLDGVTWLENQDEEFVLTMENSKEPINGELQDLFLEQEENNL